MQKKSKKKIVRRRNSDKLPLAIVGLIINMVIMPGLGTLINGRTKEGIWQLVILFGSIVIGALLIASIIGIIAGILLIIFGVLAAWIWGIVSCVQLIEEAS